MGDKAKNKQEESWYEQWFDTPYYHILYQHRDEAEAKNFIDKLIHYLNLPYSARLLDLACGKGRHSRYLNDLGYEVIGLDLSEQSIAEARQYENSRLSFYVHDMRELYWKEYFDGIFNLFTSFGYFENEADNRRVISSAQHALKPDGKLVIDFLNANLVRNNLVEQEVKTIDGIEFRITREIKEGFIYKHIRFGHNEKKHDYTEKVQLLELADFEQYLEEVEMQVEEVFGDYNLNPFNEDTSDRLIIIAGKL